MKLLIIAKFLLLTLVSCQTYAPISLPKKLAAPCPEVGFKGGNLIPQVVVLKTEYEICKAKHEAIVKLLKPD